MFIALSDLSTYDTDGYLVALNGAGLEELESTNDLKSVSVHNYTVRIPISDLIAAYNQLYGTDY
jgi:hypothetical protein